VAGASAGEAGAGKAGWAGPRYYSAGEIAEARAWGEAGQKMRW